MLVTAKDSNAVRDTSAQAPMVINRYDRCRKRTGASEGESIGLLKDCCFRGQVMIKPR